MPQEILDIDPVSAGWCFAIGGSIVGLGSVIVSFMVAGMGVASVVVAGISSVLVLVTLWAARRHTVQRIGKLKDAYRSHFEQVCLSADETLQRHKVQHENLEQIVNRSTSGIVVHRNGTILVANPEFAACLKYDEPEQLIGKNVLDFVDSIDKEDIVDALRPDGTDQSGEFHFVRSDQSRAVLSVAPARQIEYAGERVTLLESRDVTAQHDELRAKLLLADRMAAVGTLAAGVAHEINNPLAYVKLNLTTLSNSFRNLRSHIPEGNRGEIAEILSDTLEGVGRVRDIVRDLKAFSRAEDSSQCAVDVRTLVESSIKMTYNEIRHRAQMRKDFQTVPMVLANPSRLGQVFLNILVNAAQAIDEGNAAGNEIHVRTRSDDHGNTVVEVSDTGSGMDDEAKRRVFDPFFTSKPIGVGTGLGMYFCHNVVTGIGGDIEIDSEVGKGTTIRVVLPSSISVNTRIPAKPKKIHPVEVSTDSLRILIIDDERHVGRSLRRILSRHQVELATTGTEGFEKLKANSYDVVLCDLMMPDISGREIYRRLSSLRPGTESRIVFITGGAFTQDAREFLDSLHNPILNKPFEVHALHAVIREVTAASAQLVAS